MGKLLLWNFCVRDIAKERKNRYNGYEVCDIMISADISGFYMNGCLREGDRHRLQAGRKAR